MIKQPRARGSLSAIYRRLGFIHSKAFLPYGSVTLRITIYSSINAL